VGFLNHSYCFSHQTFSSTEWIFRLYETYKYQTWGLNSGGLRVQPRS
jgi:hypothetical protein